MATILLADDSDEIRAVYAPILRIRGHEVVEASDGREALDAARRFRPDLILLDIWMPGLNGFEVLDKLRGDPVATRTRVAMLSVLGDADTQLEAFSAGAVEYLVKGLGLEDFLDRVESLLQTRTIGCAEEVPSP